jgi:hypothetical protein
VVSDEVGVLTKDETGVSAKMDRRIAPTIFLLALAVRLAAGWRVLLDPQAAWCNDAAIYHRLAGELFAGRFPSLFRTPGYPLFLALTGATSSEQALLALVVQTLLDSLTAALLAAVAWRLFQTAQAAWLAGLLYAFCPVAVGLCFFVVSEPLGVFLVVAALCLAVTSQSWAALSAQAACWFAAVMVRPSFAPLPVLASFFLLLRPALGVKLRRQAAVVAAYACCLALWVGFNYARSGMAVVSTNPEVSFYIYDAAAARMVDELTWPGYVRAALFDPPRYDRLLDEAQRGIAGEAAFDIEPRPESLWFTMDDPELIRRVGGRAKAMVEGRALTLVGIHTVGALQTLRPRWNSAGAINRLLDALRLMLLPVAAALLLRRREWWLVLFAACWAAYAVLPPGPVGAWRFRSLAEPVFSLALAAAFAPALWRVPGEVSFRRRLGRLRAWRSVGEPAARRTSG